MKLIIRNPASVFAAAAIIILAYAGCSRNAAQPAAGNQAAVNPAQAIDYKRIISAAPSNTEIVIGLGLGDRLIAIDKYSRDIPGAPANLPLIDFFYPDTEAIIGMQPDLILANEINSYGVSDNPFSLLGNLGIKVVQVPTSTSIDGICSDIIFIADTLGAEERGQAMVKSMKDEIAGIAAGETNAQRKSVYFEVSSAPSMVSFGKGAYLDEMIDIAGGKNIFEDQNGWFSPSEEEIINRNPDIIFVLQYPGEDPVTEIKNRRAFETITAVKQNQIFPVDANSASRPSQNIMTALRQMAKAINR